METSKLPPVTAASRNLVLLGLSLIFFSSHHMPEGSWFWLCTHPHESRVWHHLNYKCPIPWNHDGDVGSSKKRSQGVRKGALKREPLREDFKDGQ